MSNVGYVLITYGVVDAICSATFGNFIQYVGRVPIFLGGAFLNIICLVILWTWTPNPDQSYVFFFIAALWGAGDAVWQTQINGKFFQPIFLKVDQCQPHEKFWTACQSSQVVNWVKTRPRLAGNQIPFGGTRFGFTSVGGYDRGYPTFIIGTYSSKTKSGSSEGNLISC